MMKMNTVKLTLVLAPSTGMATTILQTADIQMADIVHRFQTIELRPTEIDASTQQFPDRIVRTNPDGGSVTFWNKPTIIQAVKAAPSGNYYEFHKAGSVVARYGANSYSQYWSSPLSAREGDGYSYFS